MRQQWLWYQDTRYQWQSCLTTFWHLKTWLSLFLKLNWFNYFLYRHAMFLSKWINSIPLITRQIFCKQCTYISLYPDIEIDIKFWCVCACVHTHICLYLCIFFWPSHWQKQWFSIFILGTLDRYTLSVLRRFKSFQTKWSK